MKKTTRKAIALAAAAGFAFTAMAGCDAPEPTEPAVTEQAAEQPMAQQEAVQQEAAPAEAPQEMEQRQEPPQMGQPAAAGEVTSEQLDEFAEAFKEVQEIQGEVQERLQAVTSPEEAQQVQQEVVAQIQERVESTGMAFQDYMMLAQRLEQDPALQQRLESRL